MHVCGLEPHLGYRTDRIEILETRQQKALQSVDPVFVGGIAGNTLKESLYSRLLSAGIFVETQCLFLVATKTSTGIGVSEVLNEFG